MFEVCLALVTAILLFLLLVFANLLMEWHLFDFGRKKKEEDEDEEEIIMEVRSNEEENEDLFIDFIDFTDCSDHSDAHTWSVDFIPVRRGDREGRQDTR